MSATNSTPTISLPLFIGTDKPAWLVDWNGAMNAIDSAIAALQTAESGTSSALAALSNSVAALSNTVSQQTTAIETVTQSVNQLAGNVTTINGNINTINSLIGNGQPTTDDKTIIGAINEINAKLPEGGAVEADDVVYDNTDSGLTATDVQAAIDEVNAKIPTGGAGFKTLRATSTTGGTYAAQLAELATAWNALSDDEKRESYIIAGTQKFTLFDTSNGTFGKVGGGQNGVTCTVYVIGTDSASFITGTGITNITTDTFASRMFLFA